MAKFKAKWVLLILTLMTACQGHNHEGEDTISYYQVTTEKPYQAVIAELRLAISDQNFRITAHSRVGHVIQSRQQAPFPEYDTVQFCNLTLAKEMLEIDPRTIRFMPCNITTYQIGKVTTVQARLLPLENGNEALNKFAKKMNNKLTEIVDFAVAL